MNNILNFFQNIFITLIICLFLVMGIRIICESMIEIEAIRNTAKIFMPNDNLMLDVPLPIVPEYWVPSDI